MEVGFLTPFDEGYPRKLKEIPDAPGGIYVVGRLPGEELSVAVIGARDCSDYGRYVAEKLGSFLGENGVTVISGMARGIDGISQSAALEAGGNSCGVLGCGVDICYPARNRPLYELLLQKGSLVSEYPPGTPARPMNFPARNRIVSGLADAVIVVEARNRSGTLITVDMALEQGKEVYVVPGRITDRLSDGCNRLLKQGANVLLSPTDFLEELQELAERNRERLGKPGGERETKERETKEREAKECEAKERRRTKERIAEGTTPGKATEDFWEQKASDIPGELLPVYRALDFYPQSVEQIMAHLSKKISQKTLVTQLVRLCMENRAVQVTPGHFRRREE